MPQQADPIFRLTECTLPSAERRKALREFAVANGWYPSEAIDEYAGTQATANGHLLVEHGMANTAVITFLKPERSYEGLSHGEKRRLLGLSYNNLVDWHLFPDTHGLTLVYNRTDPPAVHREDDQVAWQADAFERVTGEQSLSPQLKALDESVVSTISFWKRALAAELGGVVSNEDLSALFNTVILLRAYEDHTHSRGPEAERVLLNVFASDRSTGLTTAACFERALRRLGTRRFPKVLHEQSERLKAFDALDRSTMVELVRDFYTSKYAPYDYDFSVISKHALSRIYEHYVSLLRVGSTEQLRIFPELPAEIANKSLGSFYTPQYIARFFARYLHENLTPKSFRSLRAIDPACGSGIFLRTLLEMQCESLATAITRESITQAFHRATGLDIDPSACEATRLSLSLLHLVLTDQFPRSLDIQSMNAIDYLEDSRAEGTFDVVVTNPPYIKWDALPDAWRERVAQYMAEYGTGKVDLYLALLKVGLDLIRPGGLMLYVLPHTFLLARSAAKLRAELASKCAIRLMADLSDIKVFGDVSSYTILLILEKKVKAAPSPRATVVRCRNLVGHALQAAMDGKTVEQEAYQVFEVDQSIFEESTWKLLPPAQQAMQRKLDQLPDLQEFVEIRTGIVTGADDIFIRDRSETPSGESGVWRPLLTDREMVPYSIPEEIRSVVFYPYEGDKRLGLEDIKERYPQTFAYIDGHAEQLRSRGVVTSGRVEWWSPAWPRPPQHLFRPKIVCPHLMLLPKFCLDAEGIHGVTRSPVVYPKEASGGVDLLLYVLGVLNSSVGYWQITTQSHKYSRGYAMVEPKTLKTFGIPSPNSMPSLTKKIISLVKKRLSAGFAPELETEIDEAVSALFDLSERERQTVGLVTDA